MNKKIAFVLLLTLTLLLFVHSINNNKQYIKYTKEQPSKENSYHFNDNINAILCYGNGNTVSLPTIPLITLNNTLKTAKEIFNESIFKTKLSKQIENWNKYFSYKFTIGYYYYSINKMLC